MGFPHIRVFMTVAGKKFLPAVAILENKNTLGTKYYVYCCFLFSFYQLACLSFVIDHGNRIGPSKPLN